MMGTLLLNILATCRALGRTAKQITRKLVRGVKSTGWLFTTYRTDEQYLALHRIGKAEEAEALIEHFHASSEAV